MRFLNSVGHSVHETFNMWSVSLKPFISFKFSAHSISTQFITIVFHEIPLDLFHLKKKKKSMGSHGGGTHFKLSQCSEGRGRPVS